MVEMMAPIYKDQDQDQSVTAQFAAGFSLEEMFGEEADPIPNYLMKGFSEKFDIKLWDGFHKTMLSTFKAMQEGDQASAMIF